LEGHCACTTAETGVSAEGRRGGVNLYRYSGRKIDGGRVSGKIVASSPEDAQGKLHEAGVMLGLMAIRREVEIPGVSMGRKISLART